MGMLSKRLRVLLTRSVCGVVSDVERGNIFKGFDLSKEDALFLRPITSFKLTDIRGTVHYLSLDYHDEQLQDGDAIAADVSRFSTYGNGMKEDTKRLTTTFLELTDSTVGRNFVMLATEAAVDVLNLCDKNDRSSKNRVAYDLVKSYERIE